MAGSKSKDELIRKIKRGKYTPAVRRVEIPKPDGGIRKPGIPTVKGRVLQQEITQKLTPIYEPLFPDGGYGYQPGRKAKNAIRKVKEYAEAGYRYAVLMDLSKSFDTLNYEMLLNILRRNIQEDG
ncbi:MAG: reverse transcriptase domain-containing protein [Anaerovoracaceae bacterium]|nr:reverse transcriptase domain-containing protein [Anaerovoracaceae bacterium]